MFDTKNHDLYTDNRAGTGKAFLRLEPYLVFNDPEGEKQVIESAAHQIEATVYTNGINRPVHRDGEILKNLVPYEEYLVRLNADGLDNPLWRLESETFRIQVIPNVMNRLPIPLVAVGEVSGQVEMHGHNANLSLRSLRVELQEKTGRYSEAVQTYSNGRFYYVGLKPGEYTASLDSEQISDRGLSVVQDSVDFTIHATQHGDIIDGLKLQVSADIEERLREFYVIQIGAFDLKRNAAGIADYIKSNTSWEAEIIYDPEDYFYKVRIGYFDSEHKARQIIQKLHEEHTPLFHDAFIIRHELLNEEPGNES